MALSSVTSSLNPEVWDDDFHYESINENQLKPYMGMTTKSPIVIKEQLTKSKGDRIHVGFVAKLTGAGVTGASTLEGNEEALTTYEYAVDVDKRRNAVIVDILDEQKSPIELREAGKESLKDWMMNTTRDMHIARMGSTNVNGVTTYTNSTVAERNAWLTANSDRVLFGQLKSNASSNVLATALATIDNTDDKMKPSSVSTLRRIAQEADPKIAPLKMDGVDYVLLVPTRAFRDFKVNSDYAQVLREAEARGKNNPLFTAGDLYWDGVLIRELEEIPYLNNGTIDVAQCFLLGQGALTYAIAKRSYSRVQDTDYEDKKGVSIGIIDGCGKTIFNSKQHGLVNYYCAGVGDT